VKITRKRVSSPTGKREVARAKGKKNQMNGIEKQTQEE
jgi:hypothetical protein